VLTMDEWMFIRSYSLVMDFKEQEVIEHAEKYGLSDLLINADQLATSPEQRERYEALQHIVATAPTLSIDRQDCSCPENAAKFAFAHIEKHGKREHFLVLSLDSRLRLICIDTHSYGGLSSAIVLPRDIFRQALVTGDPKPSQADMKSTKLLLEGAQLLGIRIEDHIILGDMGRYYSFKQEGILFSLSRDGYER
jgi:DNA repair protein RadC